MTARASSVEDHLSCALKVIPHPIWASHNHFASDTIDLTDPDEKKDDFRNFKRSPGIAESFVVLPSDIGVFLSLSLFFEKCIFASYTTRFFRPTSAILVPYKHGPAGLVSPNG